MKREFLFLFYILSGILIGALLGDLFSTIPALSWLGYTNSIGFSPNNPAVFDLIIVKFTFGFSMAISIIQIITVAIAIFLFSKLRIK